LILINYNWLLKKIKRKKHNSDEDEEEENEKDLLRFNLSAETKVDDLIAKYIYWRSTKPSWT